MFSNPYDKLIDALEKLIIVFYIRMLTSELSKFFFSQIV